MKCINCGSEWNATGKAAVSITNCPFCGESPVVKKAEPKTCETSKEALEAIFKQFGADILLGKLNAYIADFAPSLSTANKRLVNSVYEFGASKALKENLNGSQEDKERAVKIAIRNMTEAFVMPEMAENIVYEFSDALGWKIPKEKKHNLIEKEEVKKQVERTVKNKDTAIKPQKTSGEIDSKIKKLIVKAENEDNEAQYELGLRYFDGDGIQEDKVKAFEWFIKAAENGNELAQYELGNKYENGIGVPIDYAKALHWYLKAAENEKASVADYCIGSMYEEGKGITQDYAKAVEWYSKAAKKGMKYAQEKIDKLKQTRKTK